MADDIDELLDEVEHSLSRSTQPASNRGSGASSASASASSRREKSTQSESVQTDDLTDLLDDLDEPPLPPSRISHSAGSSGRGGSGRCSSPHLADTSVPPGMSTGVTLRACDRLRCLKCDMAVVTMDGFSWADTTDYLFLRNNYPDLSRLRARLEPRRAARAYACQCRHRSLADSTTAANAGGLKWVCGGHSLQDK